MAHDTGSRWQRLAPPGAILLAGALFAATAGQPFHLDNVDYSVATEAAARTGLTVHYRGEFAPDFTALFHPPLYIYTLAAWSRIFGWGETQARIFGFFCSLLLGWIWLRIFRTVAEADAREASAWFWPLFLLHPFTLQGASIIDIDTTIYGPLLGGVILLSLRMGWEDGEPRARAAGWKEFALLTACITAALWAKLTTIWAVLPGTVFLMAPRLGWRRAVLAAAGASLAGTALFLGSYALYGLITGLDVWYSVRFTIDSFLTRGMGGSGGIAGRFAAYWSNLQFMGPFHTRWTGLLPWILAAGATAGLLRRARTAGDARVRTLAALMLLALGTTAYYCAHTSAFGFAPFKYVFPFWPAIVLCAAWAASLAWNTASQAGIPLPSRSLSLALAAVWVISAAATLVWVGDRLLYENRMLWPQSLALWTPAILAIPALFFRRNAWAAAALLAGIAAHSGFAVGVSSAQAKAHYSTTYDYGQEGLAEAACYLRLHTGPEDLLACMKDVGYLTRRRYYSTYSAVQGVPEYQRGVLDAVASGRVRYAVFTEGRGQDQLWQNPVLKAGIEKHCRLERSIGHYRIYSCKPDEQRRESPSAPQY